MNKVVRELLENNHLASETEIQNFIQALNEVKKERNTNLISDLLLVFRDSAVHLPPMQSLQTYIENFNFAIWVPVLLHRTPKMIESAKVWTGDFYAHILNSESARRELRKSYSGLQQDEKVIITEVFQDILE